MSNKCKACGKFISPTDAVSCGKCKGFYHKRCVSIPELTAAAKGWVCPECTVRTRKGDNTPVRQIVGAPTAKNDALKKSVQIQSGSSAATPRAEEEPPLTIHEVHRELAEWITEMRQFRREMTELRSSMLGISSRVDLIEQRLETVERERLAPSSTEVADLRRQIVLLQQDIDERDQDSLLSDLEIGHLPEEKGENVVHTITILAAKLGVALEERDIVFAERAGVAQVTGAGGEASRPRRIVVRLARRHLRDQMLQAARVRRTLTLADGGRDPSAIAGATAPPRSRIFLNERLTRANRQIFHRVREECRKHQWRFSWTARGKVFARQTEGKERILFRSMEEVRRVFGSDPV